MRKTILPGMVLALFSVPAFAATFASWDTNDDNRITPDEFYGPITDLGTYSDWDLDSDGFIDEAEFDELGVDGAFDDWDADADGYIDAAEWYDGLYVTYDVDENGHWDASEWDDAGEAGWLDI